MARTATLLELRTQARQEADMENTDLVTDTELTNHVNQSISDLYDMLTNDDGLAYYATSSTVNTVVGQENYTLPASLYKLYGADVTISNGTFSLNRWQWQNRNYYKEIPNSNRFYVRPSYLVVGPNIRFYPAPTAVHTVTLWYAPHQTKLSANGDTFDGINGWEEFVVVDVAIKCKQKEEGDVQLLMARRQLLEQRIKKMGSGRDREYNRVPVDVYKATGSSLWCGSW